MTDTESLIRDALLRQAERTPPPGSVLAALHRPRRSRKPLFLALATAATAAAVTVAVTAIPNPAAENASPGAAQSEVPTEKPATTSAPAGPVGQTVSLEYAASWVPEGLFETSRSFSEGRIQRIWAKNHGMTGGSVVFEVSPPGEKLPEGESTTFNGGPAVRTEESLHWQLAGRTLSVRVQGLGDPEAVARRFAESVRPDPARYTAPLRVEGMTTLNYLVKAADDWSIGTVLDPGGRKYSVMLATKKVTPLWPVTTTTPVKALGHDAVYEDGRYSSLTVTLAPDRLLSIGTLKDDHVPAEELAAVLQQVIFEQDPDMSWVGR
ncbi:MULTISPECIES: hypothetical protein [unclassified Saccharothrix]|uniref:hypothetical protein n=1 Tax=unclassified Saccharothrix TaxID=2593673 RepID=UPI00307DA342